MTDLEHIYRIYIELFFYHVSVIQVSIKEEREKMDFYREKKRKKGENVYI